MFRLLPILMLTMLLTPLSALAHQTGGTPTPTVTVDALADPDRVIAAIESAPPPAELPGNEDDEIELQAWEDFYDEELDSAAGAWVLTGSPDLPIASVIVFESAVGAQQGIEQYRLESAAFDLGELEAWTVADRGKWVCITVDGAVMIVGQAEPQEGESEEEVRQRSCDAVLATHNWLIEHLSVDATPSPAATPGD